MALMPTSSPRVFTSAPPELPGLMAASVWMKLSMPLALAPSPRDFALTIPAVTVLLRLYGLPTASTHSPTFRSSLLTMVMGNAFAAFPIVTAGIGIPILVLQHGGNPAVMAAIGMFSGYCGTLMTPMAANFNIVPAALLELPDKNAVIKAQIPTGVLLLIVNVFLLYFLMFL